MNYETPQVNDNRGEIIGGAEPQGVIIVPIVALAVYTTAAVILVAGILNTALVWTVALPKSK